MPDSFKRGIPAYPIPAVLIGKLAVDNRAVRASQEIGIFAVRVDATDLKAKEFYLKPEFIPFQDKKFSLFLPIETILREFV